MARILHLPAVAAVLALTVPAAHAQQADPAPAIPTIARLIKGTPVRLMVTKEVDSHTAKVGDRFKLRVDEAVKVDGVVVIPVGATAWGEVISAADTAAAGGRGRLGARLLYIDTPGGQVPLSGTQGTEGSSNTAGVALSVWSFGLFGLFVKGGNAHFKAGDILTGYIESGVTPPPLPLTVPPAPLPVPAAAH
ncbi:MAG TPA: hypothetical protein VK980_05310 [Sphingomonas sp.]|nr:hypothetical protein [Sphingomonas sp.]